MQSVSKEDRIDNYEIYFDEGIYSSSEDYFYFCRDNNYCL